MLLATQAFGDLPSRGIHRVQSRRWLREQHGNPGTAKLSKAAPGDTHDDDDDDDDDVTEKHDAR